MAALGGAVVIVEAALPSGSLITADARCSLGRTVGAVPGQLGVRVAAGSNDLIRDGAYLIRDARDVLDLLYGVGGEPRRAPNPRPGPPLEPTLRSLLDQVESGAATVDRIAVDGGARAPRGSGRAWPGWSCSATSPRTRSAATRATGLALP